MVVFHFLRHFQAKKEPKKYLIFFKKGIDISGKSDIILNVERSTKPRDKMREWRNWQTRTFEGRVVYTVRVQVPFLAPKTVRGVS